MTNCLRIEICRSYLKDRFHYREGDESGSIGMGNTTEEEIIREIKDQMRKLPPFSGKSAGAKDNETKTPIVFNNNTVSVESANPAPEKPCERCGGFHKPFPKESKPEKPCKLFVASQYGCETCNQYLCKTCEVCKTRHR